MPDPYYFLWRMSQLKRFWAVQKVENVSRLCLAKISYYVRLLKVNEKFAKSPLFFNF